MCMNSAKTWGFHDTFKYIYDASSAGYETSFSKTKVLAILFQKCFQKLLVEKKKKLMIV